MVAAREAVQSTGREVSEEERPRFGVVMGSGMGGAQTFDTGYYNLYEKHATRVHPFTIPKIMHNAGTSQICMEFGAQGPSLATSTACSSSGHAIGEAFHLIKFGLAGVMLAGGSDANVTQITTFGREAEYMPVAKQVFEERWPDANKRPQLNQTVNLVSPSMALAVEMTAVL